MVISRAVTQKLHRAYFLLLAESKRKICQSGQSQNQMARPVNFLLVHIFVFISFLRSETNSTSLLNCGPIPQLVSVVSPIFSPFLPTFLRQTGPHIVFIRQILAANYIVLFWQLFAQIATHFVHK